MKRIRRYLVAGVLVWLPLGVTLLLINFLVGIMDRTLGLVPLQYRPESWLGFPIPGLGVILTILILLVTGVLAANFVGRKVVGGWESLLSGVNELLDTIIKPINEASSVLEKLANYDLTARPPGRRLEMSKTDTSALLERIVNTDTRTEAKSRAAWQRPEMKRKVAVRKVTLFSGSSSTIVSP